MSVFNYILFKQAFDMKTWKLLTATISYMIIASKNSAFWNKVLHQSRKRQSIKIWKSVSTGFKQVNFESSLLFFRTELFSRNRTFLRVSRIEVKMKLKNCRCVSFDILLSGWTFLHVFSTFAAIARSYPTREICIFGPW